MADTIPIRGADGVTVDVSVDDLTTLNGGAVTDVHIQRFKLVFGSDAAGRDVDAANPLPVTLGGTQAVSGTVAVSNLPATQPVSGSVSVSNFPATQPVSAASLPLPSGAAQEHATAASPSSVRLSDGSSYVTTTSGRVDVQVGNFPASQAVTAAALTDGTARFAFAAPSSSTVASVASSASSVTLQAANANRRGWSVYNDSTAVLYLKLGATASTSSYTVQVPTGGFYELPAPYYRGVIDGIWSAANGNARVTELV